MPVTVATLLAKKGPMTFTIAPEASIRNALAALTEHNVGALVVVDAEQRPIGILSERDIVRAAARDEHVAKQSVSALMTRCVVVAVPQDGLDCVSRTMTERHIRHLPVVEQERLIGVISMRDVLEAQRDEYLGEIDTLEIEVLQEHGRPPGGAR